MIASGEVRVASSGENSFLGVAVALFGGVQAEMGFVLLGSSIAIVGATIGIGGSLTVTSDAWKRFALDWGRRGNSALRVASPSSTNYFGESANVPIFCHIAFLHTTVLDGRDASGRVVAPVIIYPLKAKHGSSTKGSGSM